MRSLAAPRRAASTAICASKWTSATTGRGDCSQTLWKASRQSRRGMAMRTTSHPAAASSRICARLASTSFAGAFSMDCTTTGAPPPRGTLPTITRCVSWLGFLSLVVASVLHMDSILAAPARLWETAARKAQATREGTGEGGNEARRCFTAIDHPTTHSR